MRRGAGTPATAVTAALSSAFLVAIREVRTGWPFIKKEQVDDISDLMMKS
jgi:hypothetical protein